MSNMSKLKENSTLTKKKYNDNKEFPNGSIRAVW